MFNCLASTLQQHTAPVRKWQLLPLRPAHNAPSCDDEVRTGLAWQVCGLACLAVDAVERVPLVLPVLLVLHRTARSRGVHRHEVPAPNNASRCDTLSAWFLAAPTV